jgi:glutaredoxin
MEQSTHRNEGIERLTVYGCEDCSETLWMRDHLNNLGVSYSYVDISADPLAEELIRERYDGEARTPVVFFDGDGESSLTEPKPKELDAALRRHGYLA